MAVKTSASSPTMRTHVIRPQVWPTRMMPVLLEQVPPQARYSLVATLTGAGVGAALGGGAGGMVGALTHAGVSEEDAHVYAEGVRRGGSLVTVQADEARIPEAERVLNNRNFVDTAARRSEYTASGWQRFDDKAPLPMSTATPNTTVRPGV